MFTQNGFPSSGGGRCRSGCHSGSRRPDGQRQPEYSTFEQLGGKTISMLTGAPFEELIGSKVPDVGEFTLIIPRPQSCCSLSAPARRMRF